MNIKERLNRLYTDHDSEAAYSEIKKLIESYKPKISSKPYKLSETDVILICYGNQLKSSQSLATLKLFFDSHLSSTINSVHLLPFYPYSSDDGFSVIDYYRVDSECGSWEDVSTLAKDYRMMVDAVVNHLSKQSEWFQGYLGDEPAYKEFFIEVSPEADLSKVVRPRALPLLTEFKTKKGITKYIWTTFSGDQVDLNYRNYKVLVAIIEVLLFYLSKGAKLIRLDAIAFLWKTIGTECIHLPETHEVIKLMREVTNEVAPETIIITETNVPHEENISYFGNGTDEAHMVYNFTMPPLLAYSLIKGSTSLLTKWAKSLSLPGDSACFFNFTASHDGVGLRPVSNILSEDEIALLTDAAEKHGGFISYKSNQDGSNSPYELNCNYMDLLTDPLQPDDLRARRMLVAQAIMLAMPGVPGIYFHSLVGSGNDIDGVKRTGQYRSINREKLDYPTLQKELKNPTSIRYKVFTNFQDLLRIRKTQPAFNPFAAFEFPAIDDSVFAIARVSLDRRQKILALFNVTDEEVKVEIASLNHTVTDLISQKQFDPSDLRLLPYQIMWLSERID